MDSYNSYNSPSTKSLYRGTQVVWYILGVLMALLTIRLILKLLGANPDAGFTSLIYDVSYIFVSPFLSVFPVTEVGSNVLEWATILAMVVYYFIAWGIIKLFFMGRSVSTAEAAAELDRAQNQ